MMKIKKLLIYPILFIAMIGFLFPFIVLLLNAFKSNAEIIMTPLSLPTSIGFDNFRIAMDYMHYFSNFKNSLIVTVVSILFILLFSSMAAYYFVRHDTKINKFWFFMMIASMIIPFQAIMIPMVSIYGRILGFIQSKPIFTLTFMYIGFGAPLAIFMYHGFIKGIPLELEDAAIIDGCNQRQTFLKVVFPLLMPISITIGLLDILWIWNDYLLPSLILQNAGAGNVTLPIAIRVFHTAYTSDYEKFLPALLLVILPILVVYIFAQRLILEGVTKGAIK